VADACVDTCCAGLRVTVDRVSLDRLEALTSDGDPLQVEAHLERGGAHAPPEAAATIRARADGACPFLDPRRLCGLQQRYGPAGLGDACAQFPRATRAGSEVDEVAGSLACPEIVRLLLTTEDPLAWVEVGPDSLPRRPALKAAPTPSEARLEPFHQALTRGLLQHETPLAARWLLAGELCVELGAAGSAPWDGERLAVLRPRWEVHPAQERVARTRRLLSTLELPLEKFLELFAGLIADRMSRPHAPRLAARVESVGPLSGWRERFATSQRLLEDPIRIRLERNLSLAAVNGLLRTPVALAGDPGRTLGTAMACSALAAVMLTLELAGTGAAQERVDACSVETLQVLAKYVEKDPAFHARVASLFDVPAEDRLTRMLLLALLFPRHGG